METTITGYIGVILGLYKDNRNKMETTLMVYLGYKNTLLLGACRVWHLGFS